MARTRNIKPSFFTNEDLAALPPLARLLFAGLWCLADREGRLEDRPTRIKIQLLPYDKVNAEQLLVFLAEAKFITRYEINGKRYIQINTFKNHQKPHKQEQPSSIPPFTGLLPKNIGTSSDVVGPLAVDLKPQPLTLKPVGPEEPAQEQRSYRIPLPEEQPADSLVLFYKVLQGAPYDNRSWDKAWGRWKAKANELLEIFGGNYSAAYQCLKTKGQELTDAGRTWNFNTIVDQAHLWRQQNGGKEYALVNRERFLRDVIEQRQTRKIEGLRKSSTVGEVLHERGNPPHLQPGDPEGAEPEEASRNGRNGRALAPVQSGDLEKQEAHQIAARPNGANGYSDWDGVDPPFGDDG